MGNECCSGRRKNPHEIFTSKDLTTLQNLFNSLNLNDSNNHLNTTYLRPLFPENPQLADNICVFIKANSGKKAITFESFQASLEVLTKENPNYQLKKYIELDKIDVLALIILDKASMTRQDMKSLKISTSQAYKYVETILLMFQHTTNSPQVSQDAVYTVLNAAFGKRFQGQIGWLSFLSYLKNNLPYVNKSIQSYFICKFLQKAPTTLRLPELSQNSSLLNSDLLSLLYLSNVYLHSANKLERIHSSRYGPQAFKDFANILTNYDSPTIFLCKFSSYNKTTYKSLSGILGGFNLSSWKNDGKYHGNSGCYIFSVTPKFHLYLPQFSNSSDAKKYTYLNNSDYGTERPGIGFGRTKNEKFRIWIDGLEPEKSYVEAQDETFCAGSLINEGSNSINIEYIEIWGLNSEMNFLTETDYLENDSLITRKPWITFNQERLPKLSSTNPQIAETLAGFERKISHLQKSNNNSPTREMLGDQSFLSPQRGQRELPAWNYRENSSNNVRSFSENKSQIEKRSRLTYERENKSSFSPAPPINRKTYAHSLHEPPEQQFSPTRGRERDSYSMTDGYYNPFKQRNVEIMRRTPSPRK